MAYHFNDNVYTKTFTPREPNIELLYSASERNIIVCLCNSSGKSFVANKLIEHIYHSQNLKPGTIALYVADSPGVVRKQAGCIRRLTNLTVAEFDNYSFTKKKIEWKESLKDQVLIVTTQVAVMLFKENLLDMSHINLMILHGCHCVTRQDPVPMKELMTYYFESTVKPHILGLANSLFVSKVDPSQTEAKIKKMEDELDCDAETASSVVSVLRYNTQPRQVLLVCGEREKYSLDELVENEICNAIKFLDHHQFNPNEMYEGYMDELDIPDPTSEPRNILMELMHIYRTLGSWSADRAALVFLIHIEKLKIATPYERHFLLLCMTFTVILKIRAILGDFFEKVCERDRVYKYTSPKILRLIEILRAFQAEKVQSDFDDSSESEEHESTAEVESVVTPSGIIRSELFEMTGTKNLSPDVQDCSNLTEKEMVNEHVDCFENSKSQDIKVTGNILLSKGLECNELSFNKSEKNNTIQQSVEISYNNDSSNIISGNISISSTGSSSTEAGAEIPEGNLLNFNNSTEASYFEKLEKPETDSIKLNSSANTKYHKETVIINSNLQNQLSSEAGFFLNKYFNVFKKKNGFIPLDQSVNTEFHKDKSTQRSRNKKKLSPNKTNTIDNCIPCHEYLYLPKFKVDKYSRYDRQSSFTPFKAVCQEDYIFRQIKSFGETDMQQLCGLIFVETKFTAKVLFQLLNDLKQCDEDFSFLNVQFTTGKLLDGSKDPKGAETEHRKQELVLKKFRTRECNLLIGTSFLEEGIDLPKCNLVVRFDVPKDYRSYIFSKERARASDSLFCMLINSGEADDFLKTIAEYIEIERILLKKCINPEPSEEDEKQADQYVNLIKPFCPLSKRNSAYVDLSTAIAHINRYCAKLPSDTFTCLTPLWNVKEIRLYDRQMYVCHIRLPINSPVKQEIKGCPMPTVALARRFAAFQACQLLHFEGELDDSLQPITKESFWMREEEQLSFGTEDREDLMLSKDSNEPRPGTTKRRQYYYKRIADSLTDCRPEVGQISFLYDISMALTYPLPEEQNTRGRKIHAPEDSLQGFGILTSKIIPQIGAFPIFTRSGEVQVKLQLAQSSVILSETQINKIVDFIHYTFTSVLRLQRYLMMFDPTASENSYFIVPTKRDSNSSSVEVDWEFLELIYEKKDQLPTFIQDEMRKGFVFDPKKFEDAVITPWYRNQEQPQYFYVAEICYNLSPKSAFPGTEYDTFEEYYLKKYDFQIQNSTQALLDVDHTSARLNFLTPRYVNRKGVALPTTSEEKKRAKRENLELKQILVPELCNIHPFPGTLWRKAVCLPCILHRINSLLLADQVRRIVAHEIGVGIANLESNFNWKPLDFGWNLSDVLAQSRVSQQKHEEKIDSDSRERTGKTSRTNQSGGRSMSENRAGKTNHSSWIEIGTWSNDMAVEEVRRNSYSDESDFTEHDIILPQNVTMIEGCRLNDDDGWKTSGSSDLVRYGSPTGWNNSKAVTDDLSDIFSEDSYSDECLSHISSDSDSDCGGLRIEFKDNNVAEAIESKSETATAIDITEDENEPWSFENLELDENYDMYQYNFHMNVKRNIEDIINNGILYPKDKEFDIARSYKSLNCSTISDRIIKDSENDTEFGSSDNTFPQVVEDIPDSIKNLIHTNIIIKSLEEEKKLKCNLPTTSKPSINVFQNERINQYDDTCNNFSFDEQPDLKNHPGPSPSLILQALTMSNANDGINLERLETIGDSFLKYAITAYLYCTYDNVHEGKLSHLRSKQVSNFSLYKLGHKKVLGESMIATKFEPHDNWLPPCYYIPRELERALIKTGLPASHWNRADLPALRNMTKEEICQLVKEKGEQLGIVNSETGLPQNTIPNLNLENMPCFIPYNLMTQHSIPDKSIADCVEALIGAYLVACGPRGALLFMSWLGIKVLPKEEKFYKSMDQIPNERKVGTALPVKITKEDGEFWHQVSYGELRAPRPPLLRNVPDPEGELERLLRGFEEFENDIQYHFRDRSYLLQALTHASYTPNRLTDCYQRLEFLGDAVLDYLITRHLYEDPRHHSPGALTDLRSALVNNTIFASLAVRHNFHKYFRHLCPALNEVVDRFVRIQEESGHSINEEFYLIEEEECEEVEDVEVPKALGDIFESIAGAIFLDSGMSLDAVWRVYYRIMRKEIELFSINVPKSPIRELFELEPETAQFGKPEKLADGKRVRVTVEVFGKGLYSGIGRNYRIAKCTAAKCALKALKSKGLLDRAK